MIHKGVGYRTPRTQAVKMGTESQGFSGGIDYDALAGVPSAMTHGKYYDSASDDAKMPIGKDKPSASKGLPFVLK